MNANAKQMVSKLILDFIAAINARDAKTAETFLAPGFKLTFPGPTEFTAVAPFLEWASGRYRSAEYSYDDFDLVGTENGVLLVYSSGSLDGELVNGEKFKGVRYCDRFRIVNGKILTKETWSDMAEYLRRRSA